MKVEVFNMELVRICDNQWYTVQENGRDRNGNSKYLIDIYQEYQFGNIINITYCVANKNGFNTNKDSQLSMKCYKHQIHDIVVKMVI